MTDFTVLLNNELDDLNSKVHLLNKKYDILENALRKVMHGKNVIECQAIAKSAIRLVELYND